MSFDDAAAEIRERFAESLALLNHFTSVAPRRFVSASDTDKAMRGLWLVSLYGAFERSINALVEEAIHEISSHNSPSVNCNPPLHSVFHYSHIQALKDCGYINTFDKSVALFERVFANDPIHSTDNPLASMLQNVDATTLERVSSFFGTPAFSVDRANKGRLNSLRERRNAVAHGREAASQVGERYNLTELRRLYEVADYEISRFLLHLKEYCEGRKYIKVAA